MNNSIDGQRAGTIGGILGLAGAVLLGMIRFLNDGAPISREMVLVNLTFTFSFCAPYLMALLVSKLTDTAYRGSLLLMLGILSLLLSFIALSGISLILLPAAVAIFIGASKSMAKARTSKLAPALLGMVAAFLLGSGFLALFVIEGDVERCYSTATSTTCSSDIITIREAFFSLAITSAGMAVIIFTCLRNRSPRLT